MLSVFMLTVVILSEIMLFYCDEGCYAKHSYLSVFIQSVTKLSVIILIVIMLSISMRVSKLSIPMADCVNIQSVVMPGVIMLSVVAPILNSTHSRKKLLLKDRDSNLVPGLYFQTYNRGNDTTV